MQKPSKIAVSPNSTILEGPKRLDEIYL